jgi:hypothetical protein
MNSVAESVLAAFALCVLAVTLAVLLVPSMGRGFRIPIDPAAL